MSEKIIFYSTIKTAKYNYLYFRSFLDSIFYYECDFNYIFSKSLDENILNEFKKFKENIEQIYLIFFYITKIYSLNEELTKYLIYIYNLILYKYNLYESYTIIDNLLSELIINNKKIEIFENISKKFLNGYNDLIVQIDKFLQYSIDDITIKYKINSKDKNLMDEIITELIKKNKSHFNLLYQNNSNFFDIFSDNREILFLKRKNYICLVESLYNNKGNNIMKYLCNDLIQKEICSYI